MTSNQADHSKLTGLARPIAKRFVRSVVVLDDQPSLPVPQPVGPLKPPTEYQKEDDGAPPIAAAPAAQGLDVKLLTDSFAGSGLFCSVLMPIEEGDDLDDEVRQIAKRADVVVLDWNIHEDEGTTAMRLLGEILTDDVDSRSLRLIVIYTAKPDLAAIADEIAGPIHAQVADSVVTRDSLRVVVLNKGQVPEDMLPDRVITEFAKMIQGLLPTVALAGMAALRDKTYRLLSRFDRQLDAAYPGHRLFLTNPSEAEEHLETALASEIQAILEDEQIAQHAGADGMRAWLDDFMSAGDNETRDRMRSTLRPANETHDDALAEFALAMLVNGAQEMKRESRHRMRPTNEKNATAAFTSNDGNPEVLDQRFAALMSLKDVSPVDPPRLWLGTMLARDEGEERHYWLCLQPRCDSVNLTESRSFPLVPLVALGTKGYGDRDAHPCIIADKGQFRLMRISPKPSDILMETFNPAMPVGEVRAQGGSGAYTFKAESGEFEWIGELKTEPAQRAANTMAARSARVGLAESTWLDRQAR